MDRWQGEKLEWFLLSTFSPFNLSISFKNFSSLRPTKTQLKSFDKKTFAVAKPIPEVPPVIIAVLKIFFTCKFFPVIVLCKLPYVKKFFLSRTKKSAAKTFFGDGEIFIKFLNCQKFNRTGAAFAILNSCSHNNNIAFFHETEISCSFSCVRCHFFRFKNRNARNYKNSPAQI